MTTMKDNKYLHGFINKVFPPKAVNAVYSITDFLVVLLEAAQKNGFLEGVCKQVDGACDAETIFGKLIGLKPNDLYSIFIEFIKSQLKKAKTFNRNRKFVIAADITYEPYYGKEEPEWIHKFKPDKGCNGSYQFITLSVVFSGWRLILGHLPLRISDRKEIILEYLLTKVMYLVPIDAILLDRGFDSAKVIRMLKRLRLRYMILWRKYDRHREVFKTMGCKKFYQMKHELFIEGEQITVETGMVFVKGIKVKGDEKTYQWVFATNIHRERPISYIYLYKHRWAIETKFRVTDELQIKTKTTDIGKRFFLSLFTVLLYNVWKCFHYITEVDVTFSGFMDHFTKVQLEFSPLRKSKEKQLVIRELVKQTCFGISG